ncbi:MAG: hypothetical protein AB1758_26105, partial [Candidatus Eremiobacterota bacterium]
MQIGDSLTSEPWRRPVASSAPASAPAHDVFRAAEDLSGRGFAFEIQKSSWWRGQHWSQASPDEAARRAAEGGEVVASDSTGQRLTLVGGQDLLELSVFSGSGSPERLDSPLLAAGLRELVRAGATWSQSGQAISAFQTYNALAGASPQRVEMELNGQRVSLKNPDEATTLAYVVLGLGDGKKISPRNASLAWLAREGHLSGADLLKAWSDPTQGVSLGPLGRLDADTLGNPEGLRS